jgi:hypothetical protein
MPWRDAPTNTEERKPWAAGLIDPALCKFDGVEAAFEALRTPRHFLSSSSSC